MRLEEAGAVGEPFVLGAPRARHLFDDSQLEIRRDPFVEPDVGPRGERDEIAIITGVVEFGEKIVRDVMTPVRDVFMLPAAMDPQQLADAVASAGYSRVPLHSGNPDEIVGMVHVMDILKGGGERRPVPRPTADATDDALCTELLFRMLKTKRHLAVVKDAAGATVGIVTLEDLIEELVGDIMSEDDVVEQYFVREPSGTILVQGWAAVRKVNRAPPLTAAT